MDLLNFGLIVLIPSLIVLIISVMVVLPEMYNDDWYYDDDEYIETRKDKVIANCFKYSLIACCLSAYIFALDFYLKGAYWLSLLCVFAPIYVFWDYKK